MIYVQRPNNNSNKYNTVFESHLKVLFHPEPSNMKHTGHFKTTDGGKEDFAWQKEKLAALFGYFFFTTQNVDYFSLQVFLHPVRGIYSDVNILC